MLPPPGNGGLKYSGWSAVKPTESTSYGSAPEKPSAPRQDSDIGDPQVCVSAIIVETMKHQCGYVHDCFYLIMLKCWTPFLHADLSNLLEPNKGPCSRVWASGTGLNCLEAPAEIFLSLWQWYIAITLASAICELVITKWWLSGNADVFWLREGSEGVPDVPEGDLNKTEALLKQSPWEEKLIGNHQLKRKKTFDMIRYIYYIGGSANWLAAGRL